ncbi:MAG: complex I NDUFA9 subunit family protein [Thiohalocapsa sp.]
MKQKRACIFGGTGFVGRHLVTRLGGAGYHCVLPTRRAHRHRDLNLYPGVELRAIDDLSSDTLTDCLRDCDLAVNLVGILNEEGGASFNRVHVEFVRQIVAAAARAGIPRLLHMSALNADAIGGGSAYLRSKGEGEDVAHAAADDDDRLTVTSFRPSVIYGRGDSFFNRFAQLLNLAPGILPLACPDARFAPVWVGDVAESMLRSIGDERAFGRRYDLCGPRIFTLAELVEYTAQCRGKRLLLAHLNDTASRLQARLFGLIPGKPFTLDNYQSMQTPSICGEHNGLLELGVHPTDVEAIVPAYLGG